MIKNSVVVLLAALCVSSFVSCSSTGSIKKKSSKWDRASLSNSSKKSVPVRTTAYTHTEADHVAYSNKTAIGTNLKYYSGVRSAAADWSKYPVGTRFKIVGQPHVYEIDDYGSALVGKNTIDLYKPTRNQMNAWGAQNVSISILKWGSFERSKEILKDRTKYSHVRKMYEAIKRKDTGSSVRKQDALAKKKDSLEKEDRDAFAKKKDSKEKGKDALAKKKDTPTPLKAKDTLKEKV